MQNKERCGYCGGNTHDDHRGHCRACGGPRIFAVICTPEKPRGIPLVESPIIQSASALINWSIFFPAINVLRCRSIGIASKKDPCLYRKIPFAVTGNLITLKPIESLRREEDYILSLDVECDGALVRYYCEVKVVE